MSIYARSILTCISSIALFCSVANADTARTKVTVFQSIDTLLFSTYYVALDKGYFAKHGLDVTNVTAGNASNAIAAVISGSATFSSTDPMTVGIARSKGAPLKVVCAVVTGVPAWIVTRGDSSIKSIKDLEGKTVTSGVKPTTDTYLFEDLVAKNHLHVTEDLIALGGEPAALMAGKSDAAVVYSPQVEQVVLEGGRVIHSFTDAVKDGWAFSAIGVREDTIAKNPKVVQAFVDGMADAMTEMRLHPEVAEEVAVKRFPTLPPAVVRASIKRMIEEHVFPTSPIFSNAMFHNALELQERVGTIKPGTVKFEDLLDMSFAREAASRTATK